MSSPSPLSASPRSASVAPEARNDLPASAPSPAPAREWPIAILGVSFDPMTLAGAVDRVAAMIAAQRPHYVVTPNVDFLVQAQHDAELHQILTQADLVLCDGKPLVWASQWLGNALPGRVAGSDLVPVLLQRATERGWKIFLLGGAAGVGAEAAQRMAAAHPSLPEVAYHSPPHRPLAEMNHAEIIARVRAAKPDIVLVCFGCPKQEKWIFRHYRTVEVPVMIGAGGTVDFLAGRLKRAPRWMRRTGTECVFRLGQEPRRLFKRYAGDLVQFVPALLQQLWHLPARNAKKDPRYSTPSSTPRAYGLKVQTAGWLHRDVLQSAPLFWAHALEQPGHCLIDLAGVQSIDSTGLAFLAHWQRRLAQVQRNLILFRPSAAVRSALERMRLTEQFVITDGTSPGPRAAPVSTDRGAKPKPNGGR
ncbi:MAG: WecB/TagA/CpsF family glycosyltransferase [Verrucomicrobia bacterium]|nr:WecB/TagA/CpsF family glycosyltransferase [Verrucomicrobiota bacterium]